MNALSFLHSCNIIQGELKPENIQLVNSDYNNPHLKIINFGIVEKYKLGKKFVQTRGMLYYLAPEIKNGIYDTKSDIWS